jgi:DNA polymerase-3 subunit alpha
MSTIPGLVNKAVKLGMPALALTDHGNMFGVKEFLDYVHKNNEQSDKPHIKPIVGCEVYVARRTRHDRDKDLTEQVGNKTVIIDRGGEHLIVLAKNLTGYRNLCKMVSLAWIEGFYQHPRVDKELLEQYHEGLIVCSACLGGEIHKKIRAKNLQGAEDAVLWYKKIFGDDYYIELQLHPKGKPGGATDTYEQQRIQNVDLLNIARKTNTKIIVSNDVHFVEEEHADAHDRLICLSTGKDLDAPDRMRYSKQEWFKSEEEMRSLFPDVPEAFDNTVEIADKV